MAPNGASAVTPGGPDPFPMPRFVDRLSAKFVPLGACQCPHAEDQSAPHPDGDWVKVRAKRRSYGEMLELSERMNASLGGGMAWYLATGIIEWNLVDEDGKPVEVSEQACYDLDDDTAKVLRDALDEKQPAKDKGADGPKRRSAKRSRSS